MISSAVNTTVRGDYIYCDAYGKLKEEVIGKYFVEYSVQEGFNIEDMYEEISDETEAIFKQAYESGMFRAEERDAMFNIVKTLKRCDESLDLDIRAEFGKKSATFTGYHTKYVEQENPQPSNEEDMLSK